MRFCLEVGCRNTVPRGRCAACRRKREQRRGSRHDRGYTAAWAAYSADRLAQHPWCVGYPRGYHAGAPMLADVTDHIVSARRAPERFMDPTNHQSLCQDCNKRKAMAEEGALARG